MSKNENLSNNVRINEKGQVLRPVPLRVNPETIKENKINKKPIVYAKIGKRRYPCIVEWVTEAEYRAYMRIEWADLKAKEREERCLIPDGSGGFIMCPECNKCSQCDKVGKWEFDSLHAVHIESFCDEEADDDKVFDIKSDVTNDSTYLEAEEIADMIAEELHKIKPKYAVIFREMYSGTLKPKQIAENTGLKVSTTYEDVEKVMAKAQELFSLLMK